MLCHIELVHPLANEQALLALQVSSGTTVAQAIEQSGLLQQYPSLKGQALRVGIFAKPCPLWHLVKDGDRIEIYRPLCIDPKSARRFRAAKKARTST